MAGFVSRRKPISSRKIDCELIAIIFMRIYFELVEKVNPVRVYLLQLQ